MCIYIYTYKKNTYEYIIATVKIPCPPKNFNVFYTDIHRRRKKKIRKFLHVQHNIHKYIYIGRVCARAHNNICNIGVCVCV